MADFSIILRYVLFMLGMTYDKTTCEAEKRMLLTITPSVVKFKSTVTFNCTAYTKGEPQTYIGIYYDREKSRDRYGRGTIAVLYPKKLDLRTGKDCKSLSESSDKQNTKQWRTLYMKCPVDTCNYAANIYCSLKIYPRRAKGIISRNVEKPLDVYKTLSMETAKIKLLSTCSLKENKNCQRCRNRVTGRGHVVNKGETIAATCSIRIPHQYFRLFGSDKSPGSFTLWIKRKNGASQKINEKAVEIDSTRIPPRKKFQCITNKKPKIPVQATILYRPDDKCYYGVQNADCDHSCKCKGNKICNQITGSCPNGCLSTRFAGRDCHLTCPIGKYFDRDVTNYNVSLDVTTMNSWCTKSCFCKIDDQCNVQSGRCMSGGCKEGYTAGPVCMRRCYYGMGDAHCDHSCKCKGNQICDPITGSCPKGCVNTRFAGRDCHLTCKIGTYFDRDVRKYNVSVNEATMISWCTKPCFCHIVHECNVESGRCMRGGCKEGYAGDPCRLPLVAVIENENNNNTISKRTTETDSTPLIVGLGVTCALIILGGVVAIYFLRRRFNRKPDVPQSPSYSVMVYSGNSVPDMENLKDQIDLWGYNGPEKMGMNTGDWVNNEDKSTDHTSPNDDMVSESVSSSASSSTSISPSTSSASQQKRRRRRRRRRK